MSSILFTLPELFNSYKHWVSKNPQLVGDLESTVKWISYFIAGRINSSNVLSELVFSLSNLLVLFNDRIIHGARNLQPTESGELVKTWLTVLEYSEVFVEITARRLWSTKGKWIVAVVLQLIKCVARLGLLLHHKENIIQNPPISPLNRKEIVSKDEQASEDARYQLHSVAFTLKRSGRLIRRVRSAPPVQCRTWKPPLLPPNNNIEEEEEDGREEGLAGRRLAAEALYVVKPLLHLGSLLCWGQDKWKPWLFALGIDVTSLHLYRSSGGAHPKLSRRQRLELSRRSVALLLYALRSPFYERYSRDKVQAFINALGRNIPLARIVCTPLAQYVPVWQDTYFYMWST